MPQELMTITLKPSSFFDMNPSNDVPRSTQAANKSTLAVNDGSSAEATISCHL